MPHDKYPSRTTVTPQTWHSQKSLGESTKTIFDVMIFMDSLQFLYSSQPTFLVSLFFSQRRRIHYHWDFK